MLEGLVELVQTIFSLRKCFSFKITTFIPIFSKLTFNHLDKNDFPLLDPPQIPKTNVFLFVWIEFFTVSKSNSETVSNYRYYYCGELIFLAET